MRYLEIVPGGGAILPVVGGLRLPFEHWSPRGFVRRRRVGYSSFPPALFVVEAAICNFLGVWFVSSM